MWYLTDEEARRVDRELSAVRGNVTLRVYEHELRFLQSGAQSVHQLKTQCLSKKRTVMDEKCTATGFILESV